MGTEKLRASDITFSAAPPPFLSDVLLTYYLSKELCQTLKKKPFAKIVNSFQSLEVVKRIKSSELAVNKSNKI